MFFFFLKACTIEKKSSALGLLAFSPLFFPGFLSVLSIAQVIKKALCYVPCKRNNGGYLSKNHFCSIIG